MTTYRIEPDAPDGGSDAAAGEPAAQPGEWRMVFDFYMGQQIVNDGKDYAISDALKDAFQTAGVTGAEFKPMTVARGDQFDMVSPDASLPRFWQLVVTGDRGVDDLWIEDVTDLHLSQRAIDLVAALGDSSRTYADGLATPEWTPTDGPLF